MRPNLDDPQGYQVRLKPLYGEMFRAAYAIIGNRDLAEFVLKNAVREAYLRRREWRDRMNFREGVLAAVRLVGLTELRHIRRKGSYELDWEGFSLNCPESLGSSEQKLYTVLAKQPVQTRRLMTLRHGCGLKERQISEILNLKPAQVHEELTGCAARMERVLGKSSSYGLEKMLKRVMRAEMSRPGEDMGEMGAVLRSFERAGLCGVGLVDRNPAGRTSGVALRGRGYSGGDFALADVYLWKVRKMALRRDMRRIEFKNVNSLIIKISG